ncbi:hypothetical protein [Photobacterium iliopiscarium]|uniref:hypothetical protein n=1 Tax=Photobacterium iliopiscarium TaxID=56192 RepID=UPI0011B24A41|nr:hypothetical protein [Photobacterium iliopiscarium]
MKTEKEIKIGLNGLYETFFVEHDLIKLTYKISYNRGSDFKHKNEVLFNSVFKDEDSAIQELIKCLEKHKPNPYF